MEARLVATGLLFSKRNQVRQIAPGELAPAYDMNPNPHAAGLKLNISESDNAQDIEFVLEVAPYFRVTGPRAAAIAKEVARVVREWRSTARNSAVGGSCPGVASDPTGTRTNRVASTS